MTPADRLTRAADLLDRMADAADGSTALDNHVWLEGNAPREVARLIAVTSDPVAVRLIAALLRDEGEWHATGMALDYPSDQFLALADHLNGKAEQ